MPVPLNAPGVYIEEVPSPVRSIVGVSTATTVFVGRARQGPTTPMLIHSFSDFQRVFGGLWELSPMTYAVQQYYTNGGVDAIIFRIFSGAGNPTASFTVGGMGLLASSPGSWANTLGVKVDHATRDPANVHLINITVFDGTGPTATALETIRNILTDPAQPAQFRSLMEQQSQFLRADPGAAIPAAPLDAGPSGPTTNGNDGNPLTSGNLVANLAALDRVDIFNILCLPPPTFTANVAGTDYATAVAYCETRRAILLIDADDVQPSAVPPTLTSIGTSRNAAMFYPRLRMPNSLRQNLLDDFVPCGAVAGICARTDAARGVWKAPAGIEATIVGVAGLTRTLTDNENGDLNKIGVNCLRTFPIVGSVVWGSRTRQGADQLASEWKYLPVRRTALFIEESLRRGLQWVVFEPNDEPLWAQIRLNVGAFLQNLFRQGAFQGKSPSEAYFVKCDADTTTQTDRDLGIVNIFVGVALLRPAEFVIIHIQQITAPAEA
jgi:phage tail sheath protein FI